jgi:hypothetical protein
MCTAIALWETELPQQLRDPIAGQRRIHDRGGSREVRFHYRDQPPLLPVWYEGQLHLMRWGNQDRRCPLPLTGWTWKETLETGGWSAWQPEPVDIPANLGFEKGVWFRIREGIRGLLVHGPTQPPHVYMLCEPPTRYYQVMTRGDRMPVLIDEVI